jgi:hypothetical protein
VQSAPTILEIVEFGLTEIPDDRKVEVSLRDLIFIHQALGELNRFFHQPQHLPDVEAVKDFMGDRSSGGGYEVLHTAYYRKCSQMMPPDGT